MSSFRPRTREKPFATALKMEIAAASEGEDHRELRRIARALLERAGMGDIAALKEVADRTDGKVPAPIIGDSESDPVRVTGVAWLEPLWSVNAQVPAIQHQPDVEVPAAEVHAPVPAKVVSVPSKPLKNPFPIRPYSIKPEKRYRTSEHRRTYQRNLMRKRAAAKREAAAQAANGGSSE